nr:PAS domain-containing protein [Haloplanus salinus]
MVPRTRSPARCFALTQRGHDDVQRAVVDAYAAVDEVPDRAGLSRTMFAELLDALDRHLDSEQQVDVLTAAVGGLVDRLTTVIDAAPIAIRAVDGDGVVRLWNPAAERTFDRDSSMIGPNTTTVPVLAWRSTSRCLRPRRAASRFASPTTARASRRSSDGCSGPQRRHSSPTAPGLDCGSPTGSSVRRAAGSTWRPTTGRPS